MDRRDKEDQVRRYLRGMKHERTQDEKKELDRLARERKATRRKRSRGAGRRDRDEEGDEAEGFEPIRRAPQFRPRERGTTGPPSPDAAAEVAGDAHTVVSLAPGRARVQRGGEEREAELAQELARVQRTALAVGDEVLLEERGDSLPRVRAVLPRRTVLSRPDPAQPGLERVLAANVERAVIVVAARSPAFRPRVIDRFLVAVHRGGVEPVVCVSKADLVPAGGERAELEEALAPYRTLGVPALVTSVATGEGVAELRAHVLGRTAVLVGQSGVGKSSLLNALAPELDLAVGSVREGDGKGRHTTTRSQLLDLGDGTRWIDTPGIRALGLHDVTRATLPAYFPELVALRDGCRFRDCTHVHEPACAVRAALDGGGLSRPRYEAYVRILASLDDG